MNYPFTEEYAHLIAKYILTCAKHNSDGHSFIIFEYIDVGATIGTLSTYCTAAYPPI